MKSICLPYEDHIDENYQVKDSKNELETWVAGWGATDPDSKLKSTET